MDIIDTLQAVMKLAKAGMTVELREKIVQLQEEVLELKEENLDLREKCLQMKQELETYTKGNLCPKCGKPTWRLESSREHPIFRDEAGILLRTYTCEECEYSEEHEYNSRKQI